jgi:general secretion pathway protein J
MRSPLPCLRAGFTILELLVAMMLFVLIGVGSHAMLRTLLNARETEVAHAEHLAQTQKALWVMAQDLAQMQVQSLHIPDEGYAARFKRRGYSNPLGLSRSDVLEVGYRLDGTTLKRFYSPQQVGAVQQEQVLLSGVKDFSIRMVMNRSVEIILSEPQFGRIRRVVEVPDS